MGELNTVQKNVMLFVVDWVRINKTVVPQSEIIKYMKTTKKTNSYTTLYSIKALITKGYIRKALSQHDNRSYYVQVRTIRE